MSDKKDSTTETSNLDILICLVLGFVGAFVGGIGSYQVFWSFLLKALLGENGEAGAIAILLLQTFVVGIGIILGAIYPIFVYVLWKRSKNTENC